MNKGPLAALLIVAAIAIGVYQYNRMSAKSDATSDFPDEMSYWACYNCKEEFARPLDEYLKRYQSHPGESLNCPTCETNDKVARIADKGMSPFATTETEATAE